VVSVSRDQDPIFDIVLAQHILHPNFWGRKISPSFSEMGTKLYQILGRHRTVVSASQVCLDLIHISDTLLYFGTRVPHSPTLGPTSRFSTRVIIGKVFESNSKGKSIIVAPGGCFGFRVRQRRPGRKSMAKFRSC